MFMLAIPLITGILVVSQQGFFGQNVACMTVFFIICVYLCDVTFRVWQGFCSLKNLLSHGKAGLHGCFKIASHVFMLLVLLFIAQKQMILLGTPVMTNEAIVRAFSQSRWQSLSALISSAWVSFTFYRYFIFKENQQFSALPKSQDVFSVLAIPSSVTDSQKAQGYTWRKYMKDVWQAWKGESQRTRMPDSSSEIPAFSVFSLYSGDLVKIFRGEYSLFTLFWIYGACIGSIFWCMSFVLFKGLLSLQAEADQQHILYVAVPFIIGFYSVYGLALISGMFHIALRRRRKKVAVFACCVTVSAWCLSHYYGFFPGIVSFLPSYGTGEFFLISFLLFKLRETKGVFLEVAEDKGFWSQFYANSRQLCLKLFWGRLPLWKTYWLYRSFIYVFSVWLTFPIMTVLNSVMRTAYVPAKFYVYFMLYHMVTAVSIALYLYADIAVILSAANYLGNNIWCSLAICSVAQNIVFRADFILNALPSVQKHPLAMGIFIFSHLVVFGVFTKCVYKKQKDYEFTEQFRTRVRFSAIFIGLLCVVAPEIKKLLGATFNNSDFSYLDGMISSCIGLIFYATVSLSTQPKPERYRSVAIHFLERLRQFWNGDLSVWRFFWIFGVSVLPVWNFFINTITLNVGVFLPPYGNNIKAAQLCFVCVLAISAALHGIVSHGIICAARREKLPKTELFLMGLFLTISAEMGLYLAFHDAVHMNVLRKQLPLTFPFAVQTMLLAVVPIMCASAFIRKRPRQERKLGSPRTPPPLLSELHDLFMRWLKGHMSAGVTFWFFTVGGEIVLYMVITVLAEGVFKSNQQGTICTYVALSSAFLAMFLGVGYPIMAFLALIRSFRLHQPRKELSLIATALSLGFMFLWHLRIWTFFKDGLLQFFPFHVLAFHFIVLAVTLLFFLEVEVSRLWRILFAGLVIIALVEKLHEVPFVIEVYWSPQTLMFNKFIKYWVSAFIPSQWLLTVVWFRQIWRLSTLRSADKDLGFIAQVISGTYCIVHSAYLSRTGGGLSIFILVLLIFFFIDEKLSYSRIK